MYFIDRPRLVGIIISLWWIFWSGISLYQDKFIAPTVASKLFADLAITFLIITSLCPKIPIYIRGKVEVDVQITYKYFKLQLLLGLIFLIIVCLPQMLHDPVGYRLNTYFDNARGIKSNIFPNPEAQFLFTLIYYNTSLALLTMAAFNGERKIFAKAAILLILYSIITFSRGLYLTIITLYLFMPGIKYRLFIISALFIGLMIFIPDYFLYNTLGFSLLEKFIENSIEIHSPNLGLNGIFDGLLWPFYSLYRKIDPNYLNKFEIISSNNSAFIDIGLHESMNYNAFYTFMQGPIFEYGYFGPIVLGVLLGVMLILIVKCRSKFLYRSFMGLFFITCLNGNLNNTIADRGLLISVLIIILTYRGKKN